MGEEARYPQVWRKDSVVKIKVKDDDQARLILSRIKSACRYITESPIPGGHLLLCGSNFYRVQYSKAERTIEIRPVEYL